MSSASLCEAVQVSLQVGSVSDPLQFLARVYLHIIQGQVKIGNGKDGTQGKVRSGSLYALRHCEGSSGLRKEDI